ncbi:hypothetical protein Klosneuvirus_2_136 [Klosneuvirus KNV1]|uniref:NTF2 domain-containing protein n=1 Tax=Klosneuvirus KNV1 TaxID=1977640 RepID=A0A1V0SJ12_9VIRU|nr:hypothetical protein Klosneuvirus_2_136 [Klosneuvirus KNV1]
MSFTLTRIGETKLIDVQYKYKQLAAEFCKFYYSTYDKNFKDLANSYHPKAQFTVNDVEVSGINNFFNLLEHFGFRSCVHHDLNVQCQPIGEENLLLNVSGSITINNSIFINKFVETLLIQRDNFNHFYIFSTMLKISD